MTSKSPGSMVVSVAAYRKEDWPVLRALCPDLPKSYANWERETRRVVERMEQEGFQVMRIELTVDFLRDWSRRRAGRRLTAKVRSSMLAELAAQRTAQSKTQTGTNADGEHARKPGGAP